MDVINPATGAWVKHYEHASERAVDNAIAAAALAQSEWKRTSFDVRATTMRHVAAVLRERSEALAELMATEMGKPICQGRGETNKCAWVCDYYAEHAAQFLATERIDTDAADSFVSFQPLGTVLAVMPWNFPLWQVFRFAAPALMAGNAALLKHASNVPGCALAIESIMKDAGVPDGLFATLLINAPAVARVITHPSIRAITLTGSTEAGRAVAREAGACLKKVVLELGGSDPYVVLSDADIEHAAHVCVESRLINGGQSCIAAKRFIVVQQHRQEFERHVVALMQRINMGDPLSEQTDLGPMATVSLRDELHEQVRQSVASGARLLLGGEIPNRAGAWYPPTVLTDVRPHMPAYEQETFGPVAAIIEASDDADAIRIANDTSFGLGAAVFTRDLERGSAIAENDLEAGACFVNAFVRSDPRLPFGGIKASGFGRELAAFGIREFVNIKSVYVTAD